MPRWAIATFFDGLPDLPQRSRDGTCWRRAPSRNSSDGDHGATCIRDAAYRLCGRLDRDGHVKGVGVHDRSFVAYDRHVALPEDQVAASKARGIVGWQRATQRLCLHVAVARTVDAACGERDLHQPGAIDAETGLSAPQIRYTHETFCDRDEIRLPAFDRCEMPRWDPKSACEFRQLTGVLALWRLHGDAAAEGQGVDRGRFDGAAREDECAQRRHAVGRPWSRPTKRVRGNPAHISVRSELPPTPALAVFVIDCHPLAAQGFGIERRIGRRLASYRCLRVADLKLDACHKACSRNLALEVKRCEIGSCRRGARIKRHFRESVTP